MDSKTNQRPRIEIRFCPACRWWLRSGWLAQEIFATFGDTIGEVALISAESGHFSIWVDGQLIWERVADHGFPEAKELKQRIRDVAFPQKDLGHSDK